MRLKILISIVTLLISKSIISQETSFDSWYNGSLGLTVGLDENIPFGIRYAKKSFYIDFKSNFGMYATNQPIDYKDYADEYFWVTNTMNSTYEDSSFDESSSVYVLNIGFNLPVYKNTKSTISIYGGPGVYMTKQTNYDRYVQPDLNENYYVSTSNNNYDFNLNFGLEIAIKKSLGFLIGLDSKSKAFN